MTAGAVSRLKGTRSVKAVPAWCRSSLRNNTESPSRRTSNVSAVWLGVGHFWIRG